MKMESGRKMAKARTKIIIRRAWTKDDVRQMKTMAKAKSGVKEDRKGAETNAGCHDRYGREAWGIAVYARLRCWGEKMPLNGGEDMADKVTVTHCTKSGFSVVIPDSVPNDAIFQC